MGMIQKRDEEDCEYIEGVEIIERSDVPDDLDEPTIQIDGAPQGNEGPADEKGGEDEGSGEDGAPASADASAASGDDDAHDVGAPKADAAGDEAHGGEEDPANEADDAAGEAASDQGGTGNAKPGRGIYIALAAVAVVIAAIAGYFIGSGGFASGGVPADLAEDQLDQTVASYTYQGARHDVSARAAIEYTSSLAAAQNDDGTYNAPLAESIVAYVRSQVLIADAASRGIEASDEEMAEYAESVFGTSDYAEIASSYNATEEQAQSIMHDSVLLQKLQEQIVPELSQASVPEAPSEPADGNEEASSADYAAYIIGLAGDEWDADAGTWASTDGDYYAAVGGDSFTGETATYSQAVSAYYVAYQAYSTIAQEASASWSDYVNGLYEDVDLTVYGLYQ